MHIIAVDDEPLALGLLVRSIRNACPTAQISEFQSGHKALQFVESNRCDVAFLDIHMRGMDGLSLAKKIKELNPKCNLIFVTGYSAYTGDAFSMHASGYIIKPVSTEAVRTELENLRHPVTLLPNTLLRIRCFGNFEVFSADGEPVSSAALRQRNCSPTWSTVGAAPAPPGNWLRCFLRIPNTQPNKCSICKRSYLP